MVNTTAIDNKLSIILSLLNELKYPNEITAIVNALECYPYSPFAMNSKEEVLKFYQEELIKLENRLVDFMDIFEAIKNGDIS